MTRVLFFLACLAVTPMAYTFERYCRWTDRRWPPGRHVRPRHGRHTATHVRQQVVLRIGTEPEVA